MRRIIGGIVASVALAIGLGACHSTNAGVVCNDVNPWGASVTHAQASGGVAVCEGRSTGGRYFWQVRMSDHAIIYRNFIPY